MAKPSKKPSKREQNLVPGAGGGPQPNSGRPSDLVRQLCRGAFADRIHIAEEIADGRHDATPRDRIAALKLLNDVGFPQQHEHSGPDGGPIETRVNFYLPKNGRES